MFATGAKYEDKVVSVQAMKEYGGNGEKVLIILKLSAKVNSQFHALLVSIKHDAARFVEE